MWFIMVEHCFDLVTLAACRVAHLRDLVLHQQRGKCKAWIPKPLPRNDERQRERERERERDREIERE